MCRQSMAGVRGGLSMIASRAIAVCVGHPAAMRLQQPALRRAASRQQAGSFLPTAIFVLKLVACLLAGATITLVLWPEHRKPAAPSSVEADRFVAAFSQFGLDNTHQEGSVAYRTAPQRSQRPAGAWETETLEAALDREIPSNFPRRVQTVRFTPPPAHQPLQPVAPSISNVLAGKPLRYLIGTGASGPGRDDEVTVVSYGATTGETRHQHRLLQSVRRAQHRQIRPLPATSDTAAQYNEGQIDPRGPGWEKNLREQFERRKKQGFEYVELDNPDAYTIKDVIGAIELAASYGLKVIAKNPGLMGSGATAYVAHPNVYGIIVEKGAGSAARHGRAAPQGRQARRCRPGSSPSVPGASGRAASPAPPRTTATWA